MLVQKESANLGFYRFWTIFLKKRCFRQLLSVFWLLKSRAKDLVRIEQHKEYLIVHLSFFERDGHNG